MNYFKLKLAVGMMLCMALVSCNKENSLPYCEEIKSSDNIEIRDPAFDLATYQDQEYDGVVNSLALGIVELSKNLEHSFIIRLI